MTYLIMGNLLLYTHMLVVCGRVV